MTADRVAGLRGYRTDVAFDGEHKLDGGALVLIDGEVIAGVESGCAPAPTGCDVTYVPGTTMLPGLIDAHVHLCGDGSPHALDQLPELDSNSLRDIIDLALSRQLRSGVTAVRDLGDINWAVVDRRSTPAGQPHIVASGPPITSIEGHCANMGGAVAGRDQLIQAVQERADRGVDAVKVMTGGGFMTAGTDLLNCNFTLDELRLLVSEAHRQGLPVIAHAHALPAVEQAVQAGVDGIEHCTCVTSEGLRTPPDLRQRIADSRTPVCPTLGRSPGAEVPPQIQATLTRLGLTQDHRLRQVADLHEAGVTLISGSDAGIHPAKPHGVLPEAVIDLTTIGIPVTEALASATSRAADACSLTLRTGRLRAGLAADLLIVNGDAIADARALRSVHIVVARGHDSHDVEMHGSQ